jgi:HK97 family phage major capsid protein
MPDMEKVVDEIGREIGQFGQNMKDLDDSMRRDLEEVRKLATETEDRADALINERIAALTTSVAEKHAVLEEQVHKATELAEDAQARARRPLLGGDREDLAGDEANAILLKRTAMATRGQLTTEQGPISVDDGDIERARDYRQSFVNYLRKGDLISPEHQKALSVGSDPDGGYLVSPERSNRILTQVYESSPIRQIATIETIGTDALEIPVDEGEAGAGWVGETEAPSETSTPQIGVQRIPVHELYAEPKATQKLLEDGSIDIGGWLEGKIADKFARTEATAFVSGSGVRQPRGLLTYPAGTSRTQIEQVVSGAASAVTADGIVNLVYALKEFYTAGAAFLMRRATVGAVMLLKDANNQYIWRPGIESGQPSTLMGYPVREAADMPAVAANALAIAFGNFRFAYTIVDRLGVTVLRDPYTAKPFVKFYTRKRVGGDVTTFEAIKLQKIAT